MDTNEVQPVKLRHGSRQRNDYIIYWEEFKFHDLPIAQFQIETPRFVLKMSFSSSLFI